MSEEVSKWISEEWAVGRLGTEGLGIGEKGRGVYETDFSFFPQKGDSIFNYFYKNFDNQKLKTFRGNLLNKSYDADFVVNKQGKIMNVKITEDVYDNSFRKVPTKNSVDSYFYEFIK